MLVTIYTDASFDPDTGQSAGAAWIKSNKGTLRLCEEYEATSSTHAEVIIAHRAIVRSVKEWPKTLTVFVNTDSLNLCHMMWPFHSARPKSAPIVKEVRALTRFCEKRGISTRFKHVRAHQDPSNDVRSFLNSWCDRHANITRIKNKEE